jgi:hypothetical protein
MGIFTVVNVLSLVSVIPLLQASRENFNPLVSFCGMKLYISLCHL